MDMITVDINMKLSLGKNWKLNILCLITYEEMKQYKRD